MELASLAHADLARALRLQQRPVATLVERFGGAIPRYTAGHLARVAGIEAALPARVQVAGAAYRGAGIPACVRSGQAAAERLLERLGIEPDRGRGAFRLPRANGSSLANG